MNVGVIGLGDRAGWIAGLLLEFGPDVKITAVADIDLEKAGTVLREKGVPPGSVKLYSDADAMLQNEELHGVVVGTRCSLHSRMAEKVMRRRIPLFLEKPVATKLSDIARLIELDREFGCPVVVSFPLRLTPLAKLAAEIIGSGRLGTVEHVQAVNNVPYGGIYYHGWYRDESETGGLFLQKATHDFDYITNILGIKPVAVCAMKSKRVFLGDRPAGLRCDACPEAGECPEGPFSLKHIRFEDSTGPMCCFAQDTGNEDSGSALLRYETGMHASYSQNFFARKGAAARGARFIGFKGTLEFDWYTDELKVFMHTSPRQETYKFDTAKMSHSGGDDPLALNFINVMRGREPSAAPLRAGLLSALTCLKARESAVTDTFQSIDLEALME
jgi:predicted dehydrogenase